MNFTNNLVLLRKRLLILIISITFLFCALCGRLFYVQVLQGNSLSSKASSQWYRDLPLKAHRGKIYDRNNNIIVDNEDIFTIYVRPRAVKDINNVCTVLANKLDLDKNKLIEKIQKSSVGELTIKKGVDYKIGNEIRNLNLEGVYFSVDSKRSYPNNSILCQVLGYTNIDNQGQNGLEGYYDKFLTGIDGKILNETDNRGIDINDKKVNYLPSINGGDLHITIDKKIQEFAENATMGALKEWNAVSTTMLIMDVNTGGIVASSISPSFELDNLPRDDINKLNAYSKNTTIVDVYEPGSTFKIFTTAIALENHLVNSHDRFYCPGYRIVDGKRIKCWRSIGHGSQDLAQGVKNSCNCVFMDLAGRLGVEKFYNGLDKFNFGRKTNIDFFGESSGILMKKKAVKNVDLARIGFGQAVAVTPLQLLSGVCAVVNGGIYHQPHFIDYINNGDKQLLSYQNNTHRVLSQQTSDTMKELLFGVVNEGSGKKAQVDGYKIGGKTGTAQKYEKGAIAQGKYVSSFVGFAPVDNPKYAILMIVNEPSGYVYYGSLTAAPYVSKVFNKIFNYENIQPTEKIEDKKYISMPCLEGKNISEGVEILSKLGIKFEIAGEGDRIVSTYPIVDEKIFVGDIVLLRTN